MRQLTGDRQPPLILDDPFVTFDDARATRAVELLKRLTADFQVIYLTCSNRYDRLADRVIELPEPTAKDTDDEAGAVGAAPAAGPARSLAGLAPGWRWPRWRSAARAGAAGSEGPIALG